MAMLNTMYSKKEDRLAETAKQLIRCGKFREYCEVQFELKNYSKAMAFAPAVSIEYWQELAERKANLLQEEGSADAPYA